MTTNDSLHHHVQTHPNHPPHRPRWGGQGGVSGQRARTSLPHAPRGPSRAARRAKPEHGVWEGNVAVRNLGWAPLTFPTRISSVLRYADPKFAKEQKARALADAPEESASPWGKETPAPLAVDPAVLPSTFAPRDEPEPDGLVTPVEPAPAVRGGRKRVWVAALLVGLAAVVVAVGLWSRGGKEDEKEVVSVAAPAVSGSAEVVATAAMVAVPAPEVTAPAVEEPVKEPVVGRAVDGKVPDGKERDPTGTAPAPDIQPAPAPTRERLFVRDPEE